MIREIRLYFRLRPYLKQFQEVAHMKISVNSLLQMLLLVVQAINASSELLQGKAKFFALVALSAVQGLISVLAHFKNPDGTPAAQPYVPQQ